MYLKNRAEWVLPATADFTAVLMTSWKSISMGWKGGGDFSPSPD